jgi:multiple sugar transport system substrate-binding protein
MLPFSKSRVAACILLLLLIAAALGGCSKEVARRVPVPEQAQGAEPVTVRVMVWEGYYEVLLDPVIAAFQTKYPSYRVERVPYQLYGSDQAKAMEEQIRGKAKAGELDLIVEAHLHPLIVQGLIADLGPYVTKSRFEIDVYESLFDDRLLVNGRLYELPYQAVPTALMYNQDLVKGTGVTIPADSWTWEEFREAARRLTRGVGEDRVWGLAPMMPEQLFKARVAGAMLPPDGKPVGQAVREALLFFGGMTETDRSMPRVAPPGVSNPISMQFLQGKAAMGFVDLIDVSELQLPLALAPMPSFRGGKPAWYARIASYGIAENSPHKDAAWAFLSFLSGPEGALILARNGALPCYPLDEARVAWLEKTKLPASAESVTQATWTTFPSYMSDKELTGLIFITARKALSGALTPEAAADDFDKRFAMISKGK